MQSSSQARTDCECVLVAQVKMVELYHLCAPKRIHPQVSHVTPMLVVPAPSHFQSTTARSYYLDRVTYSKTTLYTDNHFRKNLVRLFQNNFLMSPYQQTQTGRKPTLKNHSQILNMRVPETNASTLPQFCTKTLFCEKTRLKKKKEKLFCSPQKKGLKTSLWTGFIGTKLFHVKQLFLVFWVKKKISKEAFVGQIFLSKILVQKKHPLVQQIPLFVKKIFVVNNTCLLFQVVTDPSFRENLKKGFGVKKWFSTRSVFEDLFESFFVNRTLPKKNVVQKCFPRMLKINMFFSNNIVKQRYVFPLKKTFFHCQKL